MKNKNNYFSLSEAIDDISYSFGAKEKSIAGAKFAGKTLFNVGIFTVKATPYIIKSYSKGMQKKIDSHKTTK